MPTRQTPTRLTLMPAACAVFLIGVGSATGAKAGLVEIAAVGQEGLGQPGQDDSSEGLVAATVALEHPGVSPGGTVWAAVRMEIKPGWHTYWPGQNDTGAATIITVSGPDGLEVGRAHWPAPHRHELPGEILDHVHEGVVTGLVPLTMPTDAPVGETVDLSFEIVWLACKEVCIPGSETVTVSVPVVADMGSADPGVAALFADARAKMPEPAAAGERIARVEWSRNTATIRVRGAYKLMFYPGETGGRVGDLLNSGRTQGDTLRLAVGLPQGGDRPVLSGYLEVYSPDGISRVYELESTGPELR